MTHWNYRIVNHGEYFALHEVFYDSADKPTGWTGPISFVCDNDEGAEGITSSLQMAVADALKRPVLDISGKTQSKAIPCPFCGGDAAAYNAFPAFDEGWFVSVDHEDGCELLSADGNRQCHASEAAALKSWNTRSISSPHKGDAR